MSSLKKYYHLTQPQLAIWQTEKVFPKTSFGNIVVTPRLKKDVDIGLLEKAINITVERNDGYRIRIVEDGNETKQYIADYRYFKVDFWDFSKDGGEEAYQKWSRYKTEEPFNLIDSELFYFAIFKTGENDYGVYIKVHHIILDGWAIISQASKVVEYYSKLKCSIEVSKESKPSYIEFIAGEQEYLNSGRYEKNKAFWSEKFSTIPEFLSLKPSGTVYKNLKAARKTFGLTKEQTSNIHRFCEDNKCSPLVVFLSVLYTYISRTTSKSDIVVGTPVLNRSNVREKNMVGMCLSITPVRFHVDSKQDFLSFTKLLSKEWGVLLRNQRYPYAQIQKEFRERHKVKDSLFDVVLSYQNVKLEMTELTGTYKLAWQFNGSQTNSLQIHINDREGTGEYVLDFDYLVEVFDEQEIVRMGRHFINLLSDAMAYPVRALYDLNILSESESSQIIDGFNSTTVDYPVRQTIHGLFEEQVAKRPENTAVVFGDVALTYGELNDRANSLAHVLREKGVGPDEIVGIMVERSVEMIVGVLGVLKAGGAYLPLDNSYPEERISYMIKDSGCKMILVQKQSCRNISFNGEYIFIDDESLYNESVSSVGNVCTGTGRSLAYVIYTSGSTGNPKGVMVEHRGIASLKVFFEKELGITSQERIIQFFSCSFDAFVWEVSMALLTGASLYIVPREIIENYRRFENFLNQNGISIATLPPSYLANLEAENISALKNLITAGSSINHGLMQKWNRRVLYINAYGPTETTICATVWKCEDPDAEMDAVPIGKPIYNTKVFVVNEYNKLQPVGVPGELCITGDTLARGYLNRPELTAEKFIPCPFIQGVKMYRTGDLARWRPDGNIEFLGRIDNQVKIRGFRIELGEIEDKLLKHDSIKETIVVDKEDQNGSKRLYAYYVSTGRTIKAHELRKYLFKILPDYMVPSYFIQLDQMPLTPSGKIDRHVLPAPDEMEEIHPEYVPPVNEVEVKLAEAWQNVLEINAIGANDNIFEYGVDSLTIMRVLVQILPHGWNVSMQDFYEYQTIRALSNKIICNNALNTHEESAVNGIAGTGSPVVPRASGMGMKGTLTADQREMKHILLTGATGFLGIHLLGSILESTQASVYCLVRGENPGSSEDRLMRRLEFYFGSRYHHLIHKRIFVLSGDTTCEMLGLSPQEYTDLSGKVDTVIHAAAVVKHFGDYSVFERINVLGTGRIIDFCISSGAKLNHISTISISGDLFEQNKKNLRFTENDFYIGQNLGENVYLKSKFEAERVVIESANKGLNASIYRVGNLTGRHSDGVFQRNIHENRFYNLLRFFNKVKEISLDIYQWEVEFTPVDICAHAIVQLAKLHGSELKVFHMYNANKVQMGEIIKAFDALGSNIAVIDRESYRNKIQEIANDEQGREMLVGVVNDLNLNEDNGNLISSVEVGCKITEQILGRLGMYWPEIDQEYLKRLFNYIREVGFI